MLKAFLVSLLLIISVSTSIYNFTFEAIDGRTVNFKEFKGKKILVVNTASECGYTPQYKDLQKLFETYKEKLVIIAFPANDFGQQEPGSNPDIKDFCSKNYGITFTVAAKVSVKGNDISPLFKWLTEQPNPDFTGDIKWNFEKFLINENGKLIHRYRSKTNPMNDEIISAINS